MKRWFWSTFIVLLSLSSSMMTIQWKSFSDTHENQGIDQQIVVSHHTNFFYIEQNIKGLQAGDELIITPPEKMEDFTCQLGNRQSCGEGKVIDIEDDASELRFTYMIPTEKAKDVLLIEDWLVEIKGMPINSTQIQLSDAMWREGSWLIGTDIVAKKEMNHSDYYMFESKNHHPPIYWQKAPLEKVYTDEKYIIYASKEDLQDVMKLNITDKSEEDQKEQMTIVYNPNTKAKKFEYLEMMNDSRKFTLLNEQLVKDKLSTYIQLNNEEQWLYDVILSVALQQPVGTKKAKQMYEELNKQLDKKQLNDWFEQLLAYDEGPLTAVVLDDLFQIKDDLKVRFFSENNIESAKMSQLQLISTKKFIVNEIEADDLFLIYDENKSYVLLERIARYLGYNVEENELDTVVISKRPIIYQFFPNQRIFELNGDRYGLDDSPVIKIQGKNYISLDVLQAFFNVDIQDDEQTISIQTMRKS